MHLTCIKKTMGQNASQLEKEIGAEQMPVNEHFFGLVNFGNTCYCNSVIQALYFCRPFRDKVLGYRQQLKKSGSPKENLLTCLADLFHNIATQKKRVGTVAPKKFVARLKKVILHAIQFLFLRFLALAAAVRNITTHAEFLLPILVSPSSQNYVFCSMFRFLFCVENE